ncbi:MAG: EamA family transporter [Bacteroidaceae bacterium]|nr:EamA family transporter [Bacteroidaceae bacterium]
MWWQVAFLSAVLLGCYDVFKKRALKNNAVSMVLMLNTLFCSLLFLPLIVGSAAGCICPGSLLYVPMGSMAEHGWIFLKAAIVLSSWLLGYVGLKHLPLTIVGPINATRPVMVLLGALILFGERLGILQWVGVMLAVISFYLLSLSGKKEGIRFAHNRWIYCIVMAAVLGAASGLYDKFLLTPKLQGGLGLDRMMVQGWYNGYQFLMMAFVVFSLGRRGGEKHGGIFQDGDRFHWEWSILLISLFLTLADFVYFYALSMPEALVSVVSMIRRGSVVVSFLFGALLFREKNLRAKFFDLLLVMLSMVFLWLGSR